MEIEWTAHLNSQSEAISACVFWAEALERPEAADLVTAPNQARMALSRIFTNDFNLPLMEAWLQEWPTQAELAKFLQVTG